MLKTYLAGIVLGVAGAIAALNYTPVVQLGRAPSMITVTPNGGISEVFHINIPDDRIMLGTPSGTSDLPADIEWPDNEVLKGTRTELFKLRNAREDVVGVASRVAIGNKTLGSVVEWVLHLPARGSLYVGVGPDATDGLRTGAVTAGTLEFDGLQGSFSERWIASAGAGDDRQAMGGQIELVASYVAKPEDTRAEAAE